MTKHIPRQEDMPLILAWIHPHQGAVCEKCKQGAAFRIEEYEDRSVIEEGLKGPVVFLDVLEERLWQNTVREQMRGDYLVHQTAYFCLRCEVGMLSRFLNTPHTQELHYALAEMPKKGYSFVQYHMLSDPDYGLLAVTQALSIAELLHQFKTAAPSYKLQR